MSDKVEQEVYPAGWSAEDDRRAVGVRRERELKQALEHLDHERFVTRALNERLDTVEDAVRRQRRRWWDPRSTRRLWRLVT